MHVTYRDQTLENERIKIENSNLRKQNDFLGDDLLFILESQKERDCIVYVKQELLKKTDYHEKELAKEGKVINTWTKSRKITLKISENGF